MSNKNDLVEVNKQPSVLVQNFAVLATPEGIQKYIFGTKKNGQPRAAWDIVKDCTQPKKKKKKKKKDNDNRPTSVYDVYLTGKKKKKKKHKKKYWHV